MAQDSGPNPAKGLYKDMSQEELNQNERLVKWLCEDMGPFDILDKNGCRNFFKETIPNYCLPSKKDFLEVLIPRQYDIVSSHMKIMLQSVEYVAVSIDNSRLYTIRLGKKPLEIWIGTAHFVHEGKFVSQILFANELKLKEDLKKHIDEWGLSSKIVCFVTGHEKIKRIINHLQIPHLFCAVATLCLFFHECLECLREYAPIENKAEETECVQFFKTLEDVVVELSKKQYTTMSCIIPIIVGLKIKIDKISPSTDWVKEFKKVLMDKIDKHFRIYVEAPLAIKATLLDPRFTKEAFIDKPKASIVEDELIKELLTSIHGQHPENPATTSNPDDQPESMPSSSNNLVKEEHVSINDAETESLYDFLDKNVKTENERALIVIKEIKIPKIHSKSDPFKFWDEYRDINTEYNQLFRMSQKYLCIPATAVPARNISSELLCEPAVPKCNKIIQLKHVGKILFLHSFYSRK